MTVSTIIGVLGMIIFVSMAGFAVGYVTGFEQGLERKGNRYGRVTKKHRELNGRSDTTEGTGNSIQDCP